MAGAGDRPDRSGVFAVRDRVTRRAAGRLVALLILSLTSAGFVAGALMRGATPGSLVFLLLGVAGLALFGTGLVVSGGAVPARRPVLVLDAAGVRRPARWPLPRRSGRLLPWADVAAITALRRGVPGGRGEEDCVVFLPTAGLAELARTAERPRLVALTLRDVPATAAAVPWCFAVGPGWDAGVAEIVREALLRRPVPVIDRRER
ncbi:hypothetical protein [Actinomadura roseirufa]|uniref:hypothetical protein n=1 Tax=Actinomadura roseirufa TaxID=2094049 RepID=UPI001F5F6D3A|nr:hypothetical protein [Actinomadura roseirufa]